MGIKTYKPYTASRRNMTGSDFAEVTKKTPEKSLISNKKKNAGRNSQGKITVRHKCGGNKVKYRQIDFRRLKDDIPARVIGIEYDPNRTANIALIFVELISLTLFLTNKRNFSGRLYCCIKRYRRPAWRVDHTHRIRPMWLNLHDSVSCKRDCRLHQ